MIEEFMEMARQSEIVQKHCSPTLGMTPSHFCHTLRSYPMVVWHRKRAFRLLSVLKLLEKVKQRPLVWEGVRPLPPLTIRRVEDGFTAHLGISVHQAKSKMLRDKLKATHPDMITLMVEDAVDFAQCEKVAVVLADMCFQPEYAQHVESAIQHRTEANLVLLHVSPAVGGVPFSNIMQQCPQNLKDQGIFSTLASELVDDDDDYLAIVLKEIADRFALQDSDDSMSHEEPVRDTDPTATELSSLDVIADGEQVTQDPGQPSIEMSSTVGPLGAAPSAASGASVPAFGSAPPPLLQRPPLSGATPRGARGALPGLHQDQVEDL